ncbi:hypothetical protein QYE76_052549 [Lolium multiflorum]|uniref:CCHC-type domain-containing protein n=1 Tax=Lolium multiflorum TaxID=4521 RepID=A0AAD8WLN6_LOLMU|nr:hypothetical protein QYE76_052549 [Lolium multiflorum]
MQTSRLGYQNRSGGNPTPGGHHNNSNYNNNNNFNRAPPRAPNNNTNTAPRTGSNAIPVATKDKATITCYECGVVGHYSKECPKRLAKLAGNTAAPAQQQRRVSTGKKFAPNNPNNRSGRLFHINAEEAREAPDVVLELKQVILQEAHDTLYSIHPGGTKMYQDLKEQFWWHGMKREIGSYIAKCDIVGESRQNIGDPQDCCDHYRFQNGSGTR